MVTTAREALDQDRKWNPDRAERRSLLTRARAAAVEPRWGLAGWEEREAGAQATLPRIAGIKGREKEWKLEILNFRLKD